MPDSTPNIQGLSPAGIKLAYPVFSGLTNLQVISDPFGGPYVGLKALSAFGIGLPVETVSIDGAVVGSSVTEMLIANEHRVLRPTGIPGATLLGANNIVESSLSGGLSRNTRDFESGILLPNVHGQHRVVGNDNFLAAGVTDLTDVKIGATGQYVIIFCPAGQRTAGAPSLGSFTLKSDGVTIATATHLFNRANDTETLCPNAHVVNLTAGHHDLTVVPSDANLALRGWTALIWYDPTATGYGQGGLGVPPLVGGPLVFPNAGNFTLLAACTAFANVGIPWTGRAQFNMGISGGAFTTVGDLNWEIDPLNIHQLNPIFMVPTTTVTATSNQGWFTWVTTTNNINVDANDVWFVALLPGTPYIG